MQSTVDSAVKIQIAIDGMGGANAPASIMQAIKYCSQKHDDVTFLIFGDENRLLPLLEELHVRPSIYEFIHTDDIILDTDKPTEPLRNKRNSSMRQAIDAVLHKKADACVSAGNTGALMLTSRMTLGSIANVKRPAIVGIIPTTTSHKAVFLDMGANISCDEVALSQFAVMGLCFAKVVLEKRNPTIGILNVGSEESKGRELEQKTYAILSSSVENFIGYLEGHDVIRGKADVIVTDGFSGNIFLKASEGAAKACLEQFKEAISTNLLTKLCGIFLKPYLKQKLKFLDPKHNNGAMLVGINGIVVKSHGASDDIAFANAINVAINLARNNVNQKLIDEMNNFSQLSTKPTSELLDKIKATSAKILNFTNKKE